MRNPQGKNVVNMLEIVAVLIMHADFGSLNETDLLHNAELIEHKMNLMLVLFDLRECATINVVEVMLMVRTVMQGFAKLYPEVPMFQSESVLSEIKPTILSLFNEHIQKQLKIKQSKLLTEQGIKYEVENKNSSFANDEAEIKHSTPLILCKDSSEGLGQMAKKFRSDIVQRKKARGRGPKATTASESGDSDSTAITSQSSQSNEETLASKKNRLFKWNDY